MVANAAHELGPRSRTCGPRWTSPGGTRARSASTSSSCSATGSATWRRTCSSSRGSTRACGRSRHGASRAGGRGAHRARRLAHPARGLPPSTSTTAPTSADGELLVPIDVVSTAARGQPVGERLSRALGDAGGRGGGGSSIDAHGLLLTVDDDGPGMPPALLPEAFDRFVRGSVGGQRARARARPRDRAGPVAAPLRCSRWIRDCAPSCGSRPREHARPASGSARGDGRYRRLVEGQDVGVGSGPARARRASTGRALRAATRPIRRIRRVLATVDPDRSRLRLAVTTIVDARRRRRGAHHRGDARRRGRDRGDPRRGARDDLVDGGPRAAPGPARGHDPAARPRLRRLDRARVAAVPGRPSPPTRSFVAVAVAPRCSCGHSVPGAPRSGCSRSCRSSSRCSCGSLRR